MMPLTRFQRLAWFGLLALLLGTGARAGELSPVRLPTPDDLLEPVAPLLSAERMATGHVLRLSPSSPTWPAQITMVTWTRLPPSRKAGILFGLGDPQGDHAALLTDLQGAPCFVLYRGREAMQIGRAPIGASNLADGQIHGIALTFDVSSGLVQLYVDGAAEFALVTAPSWHPRTLDSAFVCLPDAVLEAISQGRIALPFLLGRGLSDFELIKAALSPNSSRDSLTRLALSAAQWVAPLPSACTSFRTTNLPYGFAVKVDAPTLSPQGEMPPRKNSF